MSETNSLILVHNINRAFVCVLIVGWVIKQERKNIYYSLTHEKWKIFRQTLYLIFFLATIHFFLKSIFPYQSETIKQSIAALKDDKSKLLMPVLGLCVLAPLAEECIFRYFIFRIFGRKNPFPYLLSFFSFIFYHYTWQGENVAILFLQYSVASFGLIYIYKKSNWNLLSPILLHSLINFLFIGIILVNPDCRLI